MNAETRLALAESFSGIPGIYVTPHYRQTLSPAEGFVRFVASRRDASGFGRMATWQVWIAAEQDVERAAQWLDERTGLFAEAFAEAPGCVFTELTVAEMVLGQLTTNGIVIEGVCAE